MTTDSTRPLVLIVGGGLVGTLNAIFFGQTDKYDVVLCEKRCDIRIEAKVIGRSINLAVSHRARSALKEVGLEEDVIRAGIPMYARMIHQRNGSLRRIPYGRDDQCIMAVDRRYLNELLLTSAEKCKNVTVKFNHDLVNVNLKSRTATFMNSGGTCVDIKYDLLVGNDGANSIVRQQMLKNTKMDFSQEFIQHGYLELYFPPNSENNFAMHQNCLHIWPRNEFMLIGLPNPGGSFTGTLFMPFDIFEKLKTEKDLLGFFDENFPDALEIIGRSSLVETFFANKPSSMVTIKCWPYHYEDSCVLMGDAAHAMIPFYGQGMNAGFEDLIIFHDILARNEYKFDGCCSAFTEARNKDAKAICELAVFNYVEMRKTVNSKLFLIRKKFDNLMNHIFPRFWIPLYTMVTFSRIPYTKCLEERKKQDKILTIMGYAATSMILGCVFHVGFGLVNRNKDQWFGHLCG